MKWRYWVLICAVLLYCAWTGAYLHEQWIEEQEFSQWYHDVEAAIDMLKERCPPDVSQAEWTSMVEWSQNALGNCCGMRASLRVNKDGRNLFLRQLQRRVSTGDIGIHTIDWLWDQYEYLSKRGLDYSRRYRPTLPENRARVQGRQDGHLGVP